MKQPVEHLVLMGVAGCGKTTAAINLRNALGRSVAEADDFHPEANIAKMSRGAPLTDADRRPWLESLRAWMSEQADRGTRTIVTCSALKRSYRDLLAGARGRVLFIHLVADEAVEAVYIATPHSFHAEQAVLALEAGRPVLVEKSFALNAGQARRVLERARALGLFAMEAMWTRFLPGQVLARTLISSGALGELRHVRAEHFQSLLHVERLVRRYLDQRIPEETFAQWAHRADEEALQ